jgi:hypothetical protein
MPLYHLAPADRAHPLWRASSHRAECFVSATNEAAARAVVSRCFVRSDWIIQSPWLDVQATQCAMVRDLDRLPPPEHVVMVPSRLAFAGWRAVTVPDASRDVGPSHRHVELRRPRPRRQDRDTVACLPM